MASKAQTVVQAVNDPRNSAVVSAIRGVASQLGVDPNLALATAYQESGFNPTAVGDNGSSFGIFQLHRGGELGSLTPQQAYDPTTNARVALSVIKGAQVAGGSPGQIAARGQRPANPGAYAKSVDGIYLALTGGVPATPALPFNQGSPSAAGVIQAPSGTSTDEGYLFGPIELNVAKGLPLIGGALPSAKIGMRNSTARKIVGAVVTGGAVLVGGAGLFLLVGRRAPGPSNVIQSYVRGKVPTGAQRTRIRQTKIREEGRRKTLLEREHLRQEGIDRRADMAAQRRRQREAESVAAASESEEPL